jgi:transketolase
MDPRRLRLLILEQSKRAHVGHVGSALSVADLLAALYGGILRVANPADPDRDRFVLSKGHASLALYAALFLRGWIAKAQLDTFCSNGSLLGVHPEHELTGVDFSTGSLGQGPSFAAGAALAARMQRSTRRSFVLVSDAECNEGALWETVMVAAHHRLANLVAIVDANGQQACGYTADVLDLAPLGERWAAFGWDVHHVNGHDVGAITAAANGLRTDDGPPHVLIAKTTFGCGVSFMESQIPWHYLPMSDDDYQRAVAEVERAS